MTCKYWREYDKEFCKADNKTAYCCGTEKQCHNGKYEAEPNTKEYENYGTEVEQ